MPCDSKPFRKDQTLAQRKQQVRETIQALAAALAAGKVKTVVGPQGAVAFVGWEERNGITDACAIRQILTTGSALARMKVAEAERLAGRFISRQALAAGHHSHDGGTSWSTHKH